MRFLYDQPGQEIPRCPADLFAGHAGFNGRGATNSQDFFDFPTAFFAGCRPNIAASRLPACRPGAPEPSSYPLLMPDAEAARPTLRARIPNILTALRVVLAIAFFGVLTPWRYADSHPALGESPDMRLVLAAALFAIAAATDFLDGYLARRWGVLSVFGRIMDPFADKLLVIGAFVFLAGPGFWVDAAAPMHAIGNGAPGIFNEAGRVAGRQVSAVYPWMVALILGRELLVTSIRAAVEARGVSFGAAWPGKLKMVLQSLAVPAVLMTIAFGGASGAGAAFIRVVVWATVIVTAWSGVPYITRAGRALRESAPATAPAGVKGQA